MTARADRLRIRIHPEEMERWKAAAASHGMAVSAWMRALADEAAATGRTGREITAELIRLRQDLARGIGNNLNQIAHRLHSTGHADRTAIDEAARAARDAMREIERALRIIKPPRPRRDR
jgi:hypothetical protein